MTKNTNLEGLDIELLRSLVNTPQRQEFKKYIGIQKNMLEDTIWSLKLDSYKANGSTVLIRKREVYEQIEDFDEYIKLEISVKKIQEDHDKAMSDLIEDMS